MKSISLGSYARSNFMRCSVRSSSDNLSFFMKDNIMSLKQGWVAAKRKTKEHPNVYSLKQLQDIAKKQGLPYTGLLKKELADSLGIKWVCFEESKSDTSAKTPSGTKKPIIATKKTKSKKTVSAKKTETKKTVIAKKKITNPIYIQGRGCNTGNYPQALSKMIVSAMAQKYLGYTKTQAAQKTKDELCIALSKVEGIVPLSDEKLEEYEKKGKAKKAEKKKEKKKEGPKKKTKKEEKLEKLKQEEAYHLAKDFEVEKKKSSIQTKKSPLDSSCIKQSKLKLHPYQEKAVNHIRLYRGAVLAFEVGAGKSLTAIAAAQCALSDGSVNEIVVVAPPQLVNNMQDTLKKFGVSKVDSEKYSFYSITLFAKTFKGNGVDKFPKNAMLIIDEAHKLKKNLNPEKSYGRVNTDSTAARVGIECAKKAEKVVLLTGTPVSNHPVDVVNLVAMVRGENELTESQFNKLLSNEKAFDNYMKCVFEFYKNPKSEDFPSSEVHNIELHMGKEYYDKYRKVEKKEMTAKGMVSKSGELKAAFYSNVRQATNAFKPNPKIKEALKIIKKGRKTLVYSAFKDAGVNILKDELRNIGVKYDSIDGSMPVKKREIAKDKFNDPTSGINVLLITQAASVGLDLKGVRDVIFLEKGWKSSDEEQIIGRAIRFKSHAHLPLKDRKVDVWHLILKKPVKKEKGDTNPSADEILEKKIKEKDIENIPFEERLRKAGIGKNKDCTPVSKLKILEELKVIKKGQVKLGSKVKYLPS